VLHYVTQHLVLQFLRLLKGDELLSISWGCHQDKIK
jgi:hypothetical protein